MPKAKPTQVIVHRIELQEKERDMLETFVVGKTVNNLLEPAIALGAVWVTYKAADTIDVKVLGAQDTAGKVRVWAVMCDISGSDESASNS